MKNDLSNEPFTLRRSQVAIEMVGGLQGLEPISTVIATAPPPEMPPICRKEVIVKAPIFLSPLSTKPLLPVPKDLDMLREADI